MSRCPCSRAANRSACRRARAHLAECVRVIQRGGVGDSVFVCDSNDRLVGVLTERDVFGDLVTGEVDLSRPVDSLLNTEPKTLRLDQTILDAIDLMQTGRYRNIPLVDDAGHLVGASARTTSFATSPSRSRRSFSTFHPDRTCRWKSLRGRDHRTTRTSASPIIQELEGVDRFAGDSGDGMQLTGTQFTSTSAVFGNDISTCPTSRRRSRARRHAAGRLRLPDQLLVRRHLHARRRAGRARRDEPGGAQDEHRRPAAGRRAHRQQRRVHAAEPEQGRLREQPAGRRDAQGLHRVRGPDQHAQRRARSKGST